MMQRFKHHIFVCVNERPATGRPSCGARNSAALFAALQRAIGASEELCGAVAVTRCSCLGPCFDGPNMVVYPEGVWYAGVSQADIAELVESHLIGGTPVARLFYEWPPDQEEDSDQDQEIEDRDEIADVDKGEIADPGGEVSQPPSDPNATA